MSKPPANKKVTAQTQAQLVQYYTGPLPDPKSLREYDQLMPGLAERIIKMAELEQSCKIKAIEQEQNRNDQITKLCRKAPGFSHGELSSLTLIRKICPRLGLERVLSML